MNLVAWSSEIFDTQKSTQNEFFKSVFSSNWFCRKEELRIVWNCLIICLHICIIPRSGMIFESTDPFISFLFKPILHHHSIIHQTIQPAKRYSFDWPICCPIANTQCNTVFGVLFLPTWPSILPFQCLRGLMPHLQVLAVVPAIRAILEEIAANEHSEKEWTDGCEENDVSILFWKLCLFWTRINICC